MSCRLLFIAALILLTACEDINRQSSVPNMPVNYTVHITREHPHFVVANGFQTMTVVQKQFLEDHIGYAGLLIWVGMDNAYHAADLCCPNCLIKTKPVEVDGLYAICPTCGEEYDLSYGLANPTKGLTQYPLKEYQAILNNTVSGYTLRIIN